jgi:hypothetical protein
MRLKDTSVVPPIGFTYQDHDTKAVITGGDFTDLLRNVTRHRAANNLAINENQEQMIHDQMCDKLGPDHCAGYGLGDAVHTLAQPIARAIDLVAGTNIRGCGSCAKRRAMLNS